MHQWSRRVRGRLVLPLMALVAFGIPHFAQAQLRLGYIDSKRILAEFKEYGNITKRQQELYQFYNKELQELEREIMELRRQLDQQSLVLSLERRAELEKELQDFERQRYQFIKEKFGVGGELERRVKEMAQPTLERIAQIVARIGAEGEYDYVFDLQNMGIIYVKESQNDLTERVLEELNKGIE